MFTFLLHYGLNENGLLHFFHSLYTLKSQGSASSLLMLVTHCRHDDIHSSRSCAPTWAPLNDVWWLIDIKHERWWDKHVCFFSRSTISPYLPAKTAIQLIEMYRNNTSPWLQKHNAAAPHTQDRNTDWNVYSMLKMTLIIAVFVFPSQVFPLCWPSLFPELFNVYFLVAAPSNLHTPTQGHVVMCQWNYIISPLAGIKAWVIERKERMGKEWEKQRNETTNLHNVCHSWPRDLLARV